MFRLPFLSALLFVLPATVGAAVVTSEIMYDLEGGDDGREWIEIQNVGAEAVDVSAWRLAEGGSNHKLTVITGSFALDAGSFAIIADDAAVFLGEHGGFNGTIYDSSFSLSNTGETIELKNESLTVIHSLGYSSDMGAAGNGGTLQRVGGSLVEGTPTPGFSNSGSAVAPAETPVPQSSSSAPPPPAQGTVPPRPTPRISIEAGSDRTVMAGADAKYAVTVLGFEGKPLSDAEVMWNFGDGTTGRQPALLHAYPHPGKYVVIVTAATGETSASDRFIVTVAEPSIALTDVRSGSNGFVVIENSGADEIDLSMWVLTVDGARFIVPEHTKLLPKASLVFSAGATELTATDMSTVTIAFPNGDVAAAYDRGPSLQSEIAHESSSIPSNERTIAPMLALRQTTDLKRETTSDERDAAERIEETEMQFANANIHDEASAGVLESGEERGLLLWLSALAGILAIAAFAVTFVRDTYAPKESVGGQADDFDIIEEQ